MDRSLYLEEFGQLHDPSGTRAQPDLTEMLKTGSLNEREAKHDLDRTFLLRDMHEADLRSLECHAKRVDDLIGRNTGERCLGTINGEDIFHLVRFDIVVHVHDSGSGFE